MWTFGRRIAAGFGLSFVLLLLIGAAAYGGIISLTRTSHAVAHTHRVLEDIAALLAAMKDMETGQRGFVITGEEAFLEPYVQGDASAG
ncbi:MAG TPA: CHASE3 domain-containing protein, partial [Vicinamibacteria bacterium]|nr:CHASE3 domain-containing protein [Vicinamibacteria bacterium]